MLRQYTNGKTRSDALRIAASCTDTGVLTVYRQLRGVEAGLPIRNVPSAALRECDRPSPDWNRMFLSNLQWGALRRRDIPRISW